MNQYILNSSREITSESTDKSIIISADKALTEMKLGSIFYSRIYLLKDSELTLMISDFIGIIKYWSKGIFKGDKGDQFRRGSHRLYLIYYKDESESVIYRSTKINISPEDLLSIIGEVLRFVEELIMVSYEEFMELILLIIKLLNGIELQVFWGRL